MDKKNELMTKMEEQDKGDWMTQTKVYCESAMPENKEKMWKLFWSDDEDLKVWDLRKF